MNRTFLLMAASLIVLVAMLWMLANNEPPPRPGSSEIADSPTLMLFCAASNRAVMEAIRTDYESEFGTLVQIQYGPSQTLLSSLEVSGSGDLYLPADDSFLQIANEKELIDEILPIARMQGVVAVARGNPLSIRQFSDLLRQDVRLVQANPEAAAIGKLTRKVLRDQNLWESLDLATTAYRTTVTDVANDIVVGAADAAIVYDAVLHTYPEVEFVEMPELARAVSQISIGVISTTKQPAAALHFARYVAAHNRGLNHYADHGFRVAGGDRWSNIPELTVFAGSMLRPAIDETITEFEKREGVRVNRVYNGCGILVAQMKSGQQPDIYFACDTEFMNQVPELFPQSVEISQNELVILVQKGNPLGIAELRDLGKPEVRVGVGHEKQCAMGWLTQNMLRAGGVQKEVMANVNVQSPTGDMLVNQMRTGSLDAAVVYLSNAAGSSEFVDAVRIQGIDFTLATQPIAVSPASIHLETAGRLLTQICSAQSRELFEIEGFRWQFDSPTEGENER